MRFQDPRQTDLCQGKRLLDEEKKKLTFTRTKLYFKPCIALLIWEINIFDYGIYIALCFINYDLKPTCMYYMLV